MKIQPHPLMPASPKHVPSQKLPATPNGSKPEVFPLVSQETRHLSATGKGTAPLPFIEETEPFKQVFKQLPAHTQKQFNALVQHPTEQLLPPPQKSYDPMAIRSDNVRVVLKPHLINESLPAFTPKEQALLEKLLVNGTLLTPDTHGQTILSHLNDLLQDDHNRQTNGLQLVKDLIYMLQPEDIEDALRQADKMEYVEKKGKLKQKGIPLPGGIGEITQCDIHYTCGAASSQVLMRLQQPAEMVRILHDMVSQGNAQLHQGQSLKPAVGSLKFHAGSTIYDHELSWEVVGKEDRRDANIIFQSAIMDKIAIGNWSQYDVGADSGGLLNVVAGNSGAHPLYLSRTLGHLTGKPYTYEHALDIYNTGAFGQFWGNLKPPVSQATLVNGLQEQIQAGKKAIIVFQTNPSDSLALHYVSVVKYNAKTDTYYYIDTGETREDRARIYTKTGAELRQVLRGVIHPD